MEEDMRKRVIIYFVLILFTIGGAIYYWDSNKIGDEIDSYRGIPVYYNGINYIESHGKNYNEDGY